MVTEKFFQQDIQEKIETKTFQWTKQWYPVAVVNHTDPSRTQFVKRYAAKIVRGQLFAKTC